MATKKKAKKQKRAKAKNIATKKTTRSTPARKKPAAKKRTPKKSSTKRKSVRKTVKAKPIRPATVKAKNVGAKPVAYLDERVDDESSVPYSRSARSGAQSGDLQGLSNVEGVDSESVDELLEEGNAFEADAVMGVQNADNEEGGEVHTREVPEDDVPEEYLDKD